MEAKSAQSSLAGQVLGLGDLVAYQKGAVVSRVILKEKMGNVTLFAFDAGQALSEHTAPFDALVQILEGQMEITISGKPMCASAGQMVIMPANQAHALKALTGVKMMLVMIRA